MEISEIMNDEKKLQKDIEKQVDTENEEGL